jgi:hypothetical protein
VASAEQAADWTDNQRGLVNLTVLDASTGSVIALRVITLSRAWWRALARALASCPRRISSAEYDAAILRDMSIQTDQMLAKAMAVEVGGAL